MSTKNINFNLVGEEAKQVESMKTKAPSSLKGISYNQLNSYKQAKKKSFFYFFYFSKIQSLVC